MGIGEWFSQNWFDFLSALGVIGTLLFTAHSLRADTKTRRITNLLAITANHREIWKEFLHNPNLSRVLDASADLVKQPITDTEALFVGMIIFHLNSAYCGMKDGLLIQWEGLRRDVKSFFSLPIPKAVWTTTKLLQNHDFAAFIDSALK